MTAAIAWSVTAVLAYAGLYRCADQTERLTLRLIGAYALSALTLALLTWR
ncbi:hypothetical protein [Streptomyces sp. LS1784]|nr:hypothetical protein [Streptomyces sp. LS1784]